MDNTQFEAPMLQRHPKLAILLALLSVGGCGICSGPMPLPLGAPPQKKHSEIAASSLPLTTPAIVELGVVPEGGYAHETIVVSNRSDSAVELSRIETSCHCLDVRLMRQRLGPGEECLAIVSFDVKDDPEFRGSLAMQANCLDVHAQLALCFEVHVQVRPLPEFHDR